MKTTSILTLALVAGATACSYPRVVEDGRLDQEYFDEVVAATVEERGIDRIPDGFPPPVDVMSRAAFRDYMSAEEVASAQTVKGVSDTRSEVAEFLTFLDLLAPDEPFRDQAEEHVADSILGLYDSASRRILMPMPPEPGADLAHTSQMSYRDLLGENILSHELAHALQDERWGIRRLYARAAQENGPEALLACRALLEGDATLTAARTTILPLAPEVYEPYILTFALRRAPAEDELTGTEGFLWDIDRFTYVEGARFVRALQDTGGWESVDAAFDDPPVSTEQVIHPSKYFNGETPEPLEPPPADGASWSRVLTVGEATMRAVMRGAGLSRSEAWVAAAGWGNDALWYRATPTEGGRQMLWSTVWDTEDDSVEFEEAAQALGWRVERHGPRQVHVLGGAGAQGGGWADSPAEDELVPDGVGEGAS